MCGRYANHVKAMHDWSAILGDWPGEYKTSSNVSPGSTVPTVVWHKDRPLTIPMRWGLVPKWSKTPQTKFSTFNARIESVAEKPSFKEAYRNRQTCLIPAQGYYEWRGEKGSKQAFFVQRDDAQPILIAGIWERWQQADEKLYSCTILTRPANPELMTLHPRMPIILNRAMAISWQTRIMNLNRNTTPALRYAPTSAV